LPLTFVIAIRVAMFPAEEFIDFRLGKELLFVGGGNRGQFHGHAAKLGKNLRYNLRFMLGGEIPDSAE